MANYVRSNAWNHGGAFDNPDLLWYAKGVGAMQARALNDPSSWWFFGAMHGEYVLNTDVKTYPGWGGIPGHPMVPGLTQTPIPTPSSTQFWDQCQHQTWFFAPWHRGYLLALEAHLRAAIVKLGGPATWALPYWDYLGPDLQFNIPPAFTQETLPDGSANPLFVKARYGPDGTGDIYVPTAAGIAQHPNDPNFGFGEVTQDCLALTAFAGDSTTPEFGGPDTTSGGCFWHGGDPFPSGRLESNPHNLVHVYVGGFTDPKNPDSTNEGLMADPGLAALDPIFYLHHANIDRLWAAWNQKHSNPSDDSWRNGPASCGDAVFVMPMPGPTAWVYTPKDVQDVSDLNYKYESLPALPAPKAPLVERLTRLGAPRTAAAEAVKAAAVSTGENVELVGANPGAVPITPTGASTNVKLDVPARAKMTASLRAAAAGATEPDRVFLKLENVRGTFDAAALSVYINLPEGSKPADHPELLAGTIALFGLRRASMTDGRHGGQGLAFSLEITEIVDKLHLNNALDVDSLRVTIVPHRELPGNAEITIGRVSIYRKGR